MTISFGLGATISNSQKLTPQMQQAIKLLQLSSLELEQEVQRKLDSNPLLERVEETGADADDFDSVERLTREEGQTEDYLNANSLEQNLEHNLEYSPELNGDIDSSLYSPLQDNYSPNDHEHSDYDSDDYVDSNGYANSDDFDYSGSDTPTYDDSNATDIEGNFDAAHDNVKNLSNEETQATYQNQIKSSVEHTADTQDTSERLVENTLGELAVDTAWEDVFTHSTGAAVAYDGQDMDAYQGATSANLQDHIRWQLNFKHLSDIDTLIADYLIDAMDEQGFIDINVDELVQNFETMASFYGWDDAVEADQIEMVLHVIQSCEPLGVGARNLAECLQIQLRKLPEDTEHVETAIRLLDGHEYLVSNNIKALIQKTGVKKSEISDSLELIRTLNPAPGLTFNNAQPNYGNQVESYDIPDVLVSAYYSAADSSPAWQVKLNPETLPKLRINQEYANLVKRGDDSTDNVYLRDNLTDARLFIRSIEERNQNLLKVATCIIERQQAFLIKGDTAMKPMVLRDVADMVGLHESTVSRLTTSKSILTPQGLFSLKHFFSSHVSGSGGDVSSTAISAMIQELITQEDPKKPLSDSAIKAHLEEQGINIARRTVAKYREAMHIGSSTQRKVKF